MPDKAQNKYKTRFAVGRDHAPRFNPQTLVQSLQAAHARLARVTVENLPYAECIKRFDGANTFCYADPPYWDCEDYYGKGMFAKADFEQSQALLAGCKGKWLVSINDVPQIRALFKGFEIMPVNTTYTANSKTVKPVQDLLIANYVPTDGS